MKFSFIALAIILSFCISCKIDQDPKRVGDSTFLFPSMTNSAERNFTQDELIIVKRICSSLKKKRVYFETLSNNTHSFQAAYANKSCTSNVFGNERKFVVTLDNSNSTDMEYKSNEIDFNFKKVLTDQSQFVKTICDEVEKNTSKISNTVRSNFVSYTFTAKSVSKGIVYDRLEILKKVPASTGNSLVVQSGEAYEFYTKPGQAEEKFMGVEFYKERLAICENSKNVSVYKETFTKPLTSF